MIQLTSVALNPTIEDGSQGDRWVTGLLSFATWTSNLILIFHPYDLQASKYSNAWYFSGWLHRTPVVVVTAYPTVGSLDKNSLVLAIKITGKTYKHNLHHVFVSFIKWPTSKKYHTSTAPLQTIGFCGGGCLLGVLGTGTKRVSHWGQPNGEGEVTTLEVKTRCTLTDGSWVSVRWPLGVTGCDSHCGT